VRIVNSKSLWDNRKRNQKNYHKPLYMTVFLLVMVVTILVIWNADKNLANLSAGKAPVKASESSEAGSTVPKVASAVAGSHYSSNPDELDAALSRKLSLPSAPPDCSVEACLALTFDDGPDITTTPAILDALKAYNAKATFFLVGVRIVKHPELARRIANEGSEIGNHSWAHPDFTKLTADQMRQQIEDTNKALLAAGVPVAKFFRPPYEKMTDTVKAVVNIPIVLWNIDPKDWKHSDPNVLAETVDAQAKSGGIMVLHDTEPVTASAAAAIIQKLSSRFKLVTVSELLNLQPDSKGIFFSR
jgi:peptidoglycan/xylan/chitin deacetylase (PgdA/CDA1 family)